MLKKFLIAVCIICMLVVISYQIYDVAVNNVPFTTNLFRVVMLTLAFLLSIIRLIKDERGKKPLSFYESTYKDEIGAAFSQSPKNRKKLLSAIRAYNENKNKKAEKALKALMYKCESTADFRATGFFLALVLTDSQYFYEAVYTYEKILEKDPYFEKAYSNLGYVYSLLGETNKALENYERAVELKPKYPAALSNIANLYFERQDLHRAADYARRALEAEPSFYQASTLLAIIYAMQEDKAESDKYYHMAISAGQDPQKLKNAISRYTER